MPLLLILSVPLNLLLYLWEGWVIAKLWAWFLVPNFGLPQIWITTGVAVSLVIGLGSHQHTPSEDGKELQDAILGMVGSALRPAAALLVGWLLTLVS